MALRGFDGLPSAWTEAGADDAAYRQGYDRVMREMAWARQHGFAPTQRQLVVAVTQTLKVYSAARGGKFVDGQRPEWLHGRADALRALVREGAGASPSDPSDDRA